MLVYLLMIITTFDNKYAKDVIDLVLTCRNNGSKPIKGIELQPDLLNIQSEYIEKGGNFWVALHDDKVVGTIAFSPYPNKKTGVLKKFFVHENFRGHPNYLGQKLYATFLEYVKANNFNTIILETLKDADRKRALNFYKKAGFKQVAYEDLPVKHSCPFDVDLCHFFMLELE